MANRTASPKVTAALYAAQKKVRAARAAFNAANDLEAERVKSELGPEPDDETAWEAWDEATEQIARECEIDLRYREMRLAERELCAAYGAVCDDLKMPRIVLGQDVRASIKLCAEGKTPYGKIYRSIVNKAMKAGA